MKIILITINLFLLSACNQVKNITKKQVSESSTLIQKSHTMKNTKDTITLGGGCYWCLEAIFQQLKGVEKVVSGFSGGNVENPTYKEVCTGLTGHAEVIQITYDTSIISLPEILKVFFTMHDPTTLNRQGNDVGTQYRSVIFYQNEQQKEIAMTIIQSLNIEHVYNAPVVTQVVPLTTFFIAEDYHQNYYNENKEQGYCRFVIQPKLEKFEKIFKKYKK